jgi:hypothetical protein
MNRGIVVHLSAWEIVFPLLQKVHIGYGSHKAAKKIATEGVRRPGCEVNNHLHIFRGLKVTVSKPDQELRSGYVYDAALCTFPLHLTSGRGFASEEWVDISTHSCAFVL